MVLKADREASAGRVRVLGCLAFEVEDLEIWGLGGSWVKAA